MTDGFTRALGFTLIEMMVVLVVAALLAGVAVPNMLPAIEAMRLRSATSDVASALRHARNQALSRGRDALFTLDVDRHRYRISGREKPFQLPASVKLGLFTAEHELANEGEGSIRFFADGSATGGRVTLSTGPQKRVVDVNWLTGVVNIRVVED